ncbi:DinB family protein [Hymenobacter sediminicola]
MNIPTKATALNLRAALAVILPMTTPSVPQPEYWLRGPLPEVPPLLQPVAHALLQARAEVQAALHNFPDHLLPVRPAGVASVGFHLRHLAGVLSRMQAYARQQPLTDEQFRFLAAEKDGPSDPETTAALVQQFSEAVEQLLAMLRTTPEAILTEFRPVGRQGLPSTVIGLLVHAAEHTTRHTGQLLVTARVVQAGQAAYDAGSPSIH